MHVISKTLRLAKEVKSFKIIDTFSSIDDSKASEIWNKTYDKFDDDSDDDKCFIEANKAKEEFLKTCEPLKVLIINDCTVARIKPDCIDTLYISLIRGLHEPVNVDIDKLIVAEEYCDEQSKI